MYVFSMICSWLTDDTALRVSMLHFVLGVKKLQNWKQPPQPWPNYSLRKHEGSSVFCFSAKVFVDPGIS